MRVSIHKTFIIIKGIEDLKKYQISQLYFYGFENRTTILLKESNNVNVDLVQIIRYFEQEGISFTIDEIANSLLERLEEQRSETDEIFKNAQEIKAGKIVSQSFDEFGSFLTGLPRKLKNHQIKAAYHLYSVGNGANFSVPGSGKTSVVLSVYEKLRIEGKTRV